jgi:hypothetical protein
MKKIYFIAFGVVCLALAAAAQPAGWNYTVPYQITNNTAALVTNYQVMLTLNTQTPIAANQMQATGNDIRFGKDCAGNTLYNYWIESGINTASTVIWVKIDSLAASGSRTFYLFYGNASASAVSGIPGVFQGPMSSTDSISGANTGGVANSQRGFRFSPTEDILVTSFGKNEPTGTTRYVTLFNFSTQAILAQTQVPGPAAQYAYANITSPIWLTSGTQYLLEIYQGAGDGYYFGAAPQVGQQIVYYDMRYCNSCTQNTFPTSSLGGMHYGYVDLLYWRKKNISPAPTISAGTALTVNAGSDINFCEGDSTLIGGAANGGNGPYTYSWLPLTGISSPSSGSTYADPLTTTNYTLTVTDATGCVTTDEILITVNPLPVVAASTANDSICAGGTTTVTATGNASGYVWTPGNFPAASYTVSPSGSTTYTVTAISSMGCSSSDSIAVNVVALPVVSVSGSYNAICDNMITPLTLTASGAETYDWDSGSGSGATYTVTPAATTTYTLVGTNSPGCMDTTYFTVTVNPSPTSVPTNATICNGDCATISVTVTGGTPAYTYLWTPSNNTTPTLNPCPSVSTCYTVTITDANGCMVSDVACAFVNPLPSITVTGNDSICAGDSTTLMASGASQYVWTPGNISGASATFAPSGSIVGYVIGTDSNSCQDTVAISIEVLPLPNVNFTSALDTLCTTDAAVTLTGGSPAGGMYSGPGVSGTTFTPATAGAGSQTVTYSYTDAFGCAASATHVVVVDLCTGLPESSAQQGIQVYPNPFSTTITIERADDSPATINFYDAEGRLVLTKTVTGKKVEIETTGLANGNYSLQVIEADSIRVFNIVKTN